jgi:hypothetical protein
MNEDDFKVGIVNFIAFAFSFVEGVQTWLQIALLVVSIGYTLHKWNNLIKHGNKPTSAKKVRGTDDK